FSNSRGNCSRCRKGKTRGSTAATTGSRAGAAGGQTHARVPEREAEVDRTQYAWENEQRERDECARERNEERLSVYKICSCRSSAKSRWLPMAAPARARRSSRTISRR